MTNKEIEKKADKWVQENEHTALAEQGEFYLMRKLAYIAGAKENGVVWHDLRKDPTDLPSDKFFRITNKGIGFYDDFIQTWYYWNSNEMIFPPCAWCELPRFEEE